MRLPARACQTAAAFAVLWAFALPARAWAQAGAGGGAGGGAADVIERGRVHGGAKPPAGFYQTLARNPYAFEFSHGWLARARLVRERRQALRASGAWQLLRLPVGLAGAALPAGPAASGAAVGGTLRYPTFLPLFSNTAAADSSVMDPDSVAAEFWGTSPAPPYSITTYYREISAGNLTVTGTVIPPIRVTRTDTFYSGGFPGGQPCQGLCLASGVPALIEELVDSADATVDFAQFADSSDGHVPAIVILDPQVGGECYLIDHAATNSIWAHRFSLSGWGYPPDTTRDSLNGHPVVIDDYIIQGGEGGGQGTTYPGCTPGYLAPIGTVTHETGHLFGLPDLYDVSNVTEGLGRWDLMSSGNEQKPWRPAHMSAWSLATLGWITEVPITTSQTDTAAPIETGRTAYLVPVAGAPHEFFLLENRQRIGSDSMMYGPGLMIYHLDTALMNQRGFNNGNAVNASWPHALAVEEAAGDTGLNCEYPAACNDRGDAGDPFPGSSGNTTFGPDTRPAALTNAGGFAGVLVDSIRQLAAGGAVAFRVRFGGETVVAASDTAAAVRVDGTATQVFRDLLTDGSTHTIAVDSSQLGADQRTEYLFQRWSDGGARTHPITGSLAGATYTATVRRRYLVNLGTLGSGAVSASTPIDSASGTFLDEGTVDTLRAVPGPGDTFVGWTADTIAGSPLLILTAARPYRLAATFVGTADVVRELLAGRGPLDAGQLTALDYLGNRNLRFDLGDFVAWLDRNAATVRGGAYARAPRAPVASR